MGWRIRSVGWLGTLSALLMVVASACGDAANSTYATAALSSTDASTDARIDAERIDGALMDANVLPASPEEGRLVASDTASVRRAA